MLFEFACSLQCSCSVAVWSTRAADTASSFRCRCIKVITRRLTRDTGRVTAATTGGLPTSGAMATVAITAGARIISQRATHAADLLRAWICYCRGSTPRFFVFKAMMYDSLMKYMESRSLEDTASIAAEWLAQVSEGRVTASETGGAFVAGLSGHLGAGKTAFVKAVAKELGIEEIVTSPTFVIMKIYETRDDIFKRLVHIDAYRLEKREDLEALRFEDVVADPHNLVMIEWPENVGLGQADFSGGGWLRSEIREGVYTIQLN